MTHMIWVICDHEHRTNVTIRKYVMYVNPESVVVTSSVWRHRWLWRHGCHELRDRIASRHRPKVQFVFKINLKYILLLTNINLFPPLKASLSSYMNQKLIFLGLLDVLKVPNHGILIIRFKKSIFFRRPRDELGRGPSKNDRPSDPSLVYSRNGSWKNWTSFVWLIFPS